MRCEDFRRSDNVEDDREGGGGGLGGGGGDVEAALQTAAAIGDDRLQKQARGYVVPDAFTHGSSKQRQRWFTSGLKEGEVSACNTFVASSFSRTRNIPGELIPLRDRRSHLDHRSHHRG